MTYRLPRGFLLLIVFGLSFDLTFALEIRVANTTLTVPEIAEEFGYQTLNALPGLTFNRPVALVTQPGETNRLFVLEKSGTICVITNLVAPTKTTFLDITDRVRSDDPEEGLLGLVFHPDYRNNGFFFIFYTTDITTSQGFGRHDRLSRLSVDPNNVNAGLQDSELPFISQWDRAPYHNAGDLHFGSEGYLYVSLGDEGGAGGQFGNSRVIDQNFFSAILRIDIDRREGNLEPNSHPAIHLDEQGESYYRIPADNPFIGGTQYNGSQIDPASVRTEFWAAGFRNPWRMTFDPLTGLLYCADVGQVGYEEVNIVWPGADYGWNYKEGMHDFDLGIPPNTIDESDLTGPILEYPQSDGAPIPGGIGEGRSVIGGVVYRGNRFPQLNGLYIFGDWMRSRIFALRYNQSSGQVEDFRQLTSVSFVNAFGVDPSNHDVLMARDNGVIERLIYSSSPVQGEPLPPLISQTGAFSDLSTLTPHPGIVPYEINLPFWSDYAIKSRWFSIPSLDDTMAFGATDNWSFPDGTVWIKHFDFELTNGVANSRRRLETRFIVKNDDGVHGFTYRWNVNQTEAELVPEAGVEEILRVRNPDGTLLREQTWRYPARGECLDCHTAVGGFALGFNTLQMNRAYDYGNGLTNQIEVLSKVGYFDTLVTDVHTLPALSRPNATEVSLEQRVRSYLQANCMQCHQPGGPSQGNWDARIAVPTASANLINGILVNNLGDTANRVLVPEDADHSILLHKMSTRGPGQMPPLASSIADPTGVALITEWINAGLPTGIPDGSMVNDIALESDGRIRLTISGQAGRVFSIEFSTDLKVWSVVASFEMGESGISTYFDSPEMETTVPGFFRIAWP